MTGDTDDEVFARYRRRDPYISRGQALALNALNKRYAPLLGAAQQKLEERRAADAEALRRKLFGHPSRPRDPGTPRRSAARASAAAPALM